MLLHSVPLTSFRLANGFLRERIEVVRSVTLGQQYEQCEQTGRIDNFRRAAGTKQGEFHGRYYNDSDVYKWLEAASNALATQPDPALEETVEALIAEIAAAQAPNGYLNAYFTFQLERDRWADLTNKHEMYCAGHFIEAAVAHFRATRKRSALDVAIRLADHICDTFGPAARRGTDGHEEIELAMVALYRAGCAWADTARTKRLAVSPGSLAGAGAAGDRGTRGACDVSGDWDDRRLRRDG
jgi:uncharacterized protein